MGKLLGPWSLAWGLPLGPGCGIEGRGGGQETSPSQEAPHPEALKREVWQGREVSVPDLAC